MQCSSCGKMLDEGVTFCPQCGKLINCMSNDIGNQLLYRLAPNNERSYSITVNRDKVLFDGDFWYLQDKEFVKCRDKKDIALIQRFLGMGYITKRSPKKCIMFVLVGTVLEVVKMIFDKIAEWVDKANEYLQWFEQTISLPNWMSYTINIIAFICILSAIALFLSKKKVIEISFVDKRICVPHNSMSTNEYNMLYQSIQNAKRYI